MTLGYVALSFALAFWQRPGKASSDTKIDLHVDPASLVAQAASTWTTSIDLGAVHSAQYTGYVWPMGPVYAALHAIDLSPWVAHRLWLGLVYALSVWGILRLLDVLVGRPRGVAHLVAAAFYLLNPYTAVFTARTSIALVGYAALPWLLLVVFHGVRSVQGWRGGWRGWWWAAVFALILTSLGGGINAAVVGWMLVGPLVLLIHEPLMGSVRWRDSASFLLRMGLLGTLASLWWIAPLVVHARFGIDFLQFTEQPGTIWATNSAAEVLRLMAYWTSYVGVGFRGFETPLFTESGTLLFNPLVVGASLLLPALAVVGFVWTRRMPYAPFLLLILLVGAVIEVAGFPDGTPMRDTMVWLYRNVPILAFMRTTQKAAPLVAIGAAGLLGLTAGLAWARLKALGPGTLRRVALAGAPVALGALILLAALPLVRGTAVEKQMVWDEIPPAWVQAGAELNRDLPDNSRALVLPGQIFAFYKWGGTIDAILPRVTDQPVAVRYETPYGDPRGTDLLFTVDRLVQQDRLFPGQLPPLLRLMGAGAVITGSDDDIGRSGAVEASAAAATLAGQGLGRPSRAYGPTTPLPQPRGDVGPPAMLPQVRRYEVPERRGIVQVAPNGPAAVVDGGAEGLATMAAFGELPEERPIMYAADLGAGELREQAAAGADVVVTDSNRRRRFLPEFAEQNLGATLGENEPLNVNQATIDPFPERGVAAQTVAALRGARYLRAPSDGGLLEFPEHAPLAAFDGDLATTWAADRYRQESDRWLEIGFQAPRDVPYVDLVPIRDWRGIEREVDVNGVRARLGPGVTRVRLNQRDVGALRVTITKVDQPPGDLRGSGGFREIRIPGVRVSAPLRTPVLAARALAGRDLRRSSVTYLFERTTADRPFHRDRRTDSPLLELPRNREDPERALDRLTFAPAARSYAVDAWVQPAITTSDATLDRLAGVRGPATFTSSDRFHNRAANRASSAFDGRAQTSWLGVWARPSNPHPWIAFRARRALTVSSLRIGVSAEAVRRPTLVRVSWPGGRTGPLRPAADGTVTLPRPVRARGFRVTILDARFPASATARQRTTRAVGIASLDVPGLEPVTLPTTGALRSACGDASISAGGRTVALRPRGTVADLLAGRPLRARACGGEVELGSGVQRVRGRPAPFAVDLLRLRSAAPTPAASTGPSGGRVVDGGSIGRSSVTGARVALDGPSWLVLGQSYSKGWEATCDGRSLGEPRPINGYANGWRAPADCRAVDFTFGPQATALTGYLISGAVCLALVAFVLAGRLLARRDPAPAPTQRLASLLPAEAARPMPLPRAAALALLLTLPLSFLFAARTSVLIFPGLTLILWRGIGVRALVLTAAGLLGVVVPVIYAVVSPEDQGGFNFEYSIETIYAHWTAVAALVLLMVACGRALATARRQRRPPRPLGAGDLPADPEHERDRRLDLAPVGRAAGP